MRRTGPVLAASALLAAGCGGGKPTIAFVRQDGGWRLTRDQP